MTILRTILAFAVLLAGAASAQSSAVTVGLRIVDENSAALANAVVSIRDHRLVADADGRVVFQVKAGHPISVQVSAAGHYPMVHTLSTASADLQQVADIQLVEKKAGRQLLLFAGDAMLGRRFFESRAGEHTLVRRSNVFEDGQKLLRVIQPYVTLADIASVNMETQLAAEEPKTPLPKSVTFYSPPELAGLLEWAGFDYVALGNNHTFDYRDAGVRSTLKAIRDTQLGYSGAGFNATEARKPHRTQLGDGLFAYLSYVGWPGGFTPSQAATPSKGGAALGNEEVIIDDVTAIGDDEVTVLQYHSGIEYAEGPSLSEFSNLRTAVDAGADVAIGHHSHVVQGLEIYRDRLIAYSMGNFLFDQYIYSTQGGMLLYVWMDDDKFHRAEVVPLNINGYVPTPATGAFRHWVLSRIAGLSKKFGTCMRASGSHGILGTDIDCATEIFSAPPGEISNRPVSLRHAGLSPLDAKQMSHGQQQYRLGTDLLSRGDFESDGLFGTPVRSWLIGKQARLVAGSGPDNRRELQVTLDSNEAVRTGMKVFDRAFQSSNPATLSLRIQSDGDVTVRFYLQRRQIDAGLADALENGPLTNIGSIDAADGDWQAFSFDHLMPRLATKSVRLLVELQRNGRPKGPVKVRLDDLAWVEWRSPWLNAGDDMAMHATHAQFRRNPVAN